MSVRRAITKGSRGSNLQQEGKQSIKSTTSQSQDNAEGAALHATAGKA